MFAATERDEDIVFFARFHVDVLPHNEPVAQLLYGVLPDGDKSLFPSLAVYADVTLFEVEFAQLQVHQFADAKSATEQHFDDGEVAYAFRFAQVDGLFYRIDFGQAQHFGQMFAYLRTLQQLGGVGLDLFFEGQEAVERTHATQDASHRAGSHAKLLQSLCELVQLLERDVSEVDALVGIVVQQLLQVFQISIERVRSVRPLQPQILEVPA